MPLVIVALGSSRDTVLSSACPELYRAVYWCGELARLDLQTYLEGDVFSGYAVTKAAVKTTQSFVKFPSGED